MTRIVRAIKVKTKPVSLMWYVCVPFLPIIVTQHDLMLLPLPILIPHTVQTLEPAACESLPIKCAPYVEPSFAARNKPSAVPGFVEI